MRAVQQFRSRALAAAALATAAAVCGEAHAQAQLPSTVYIWPMGNTDQNSMMASLAGVVNRTTNGELLLSPDNGTSPNPRYWLDRLKEQYPTVESQVQSNPITLINQYKSKLSGYVYYDQSTNPVSLNVATSIAGVANAIVVNPNTRLNAIIAGLPMIADVRAADKTYDWLYNHATYGPMFNKDALFHQASWFDHQLRDYAVMKKGFVYYSDPTTNLAPYAAQQNKHGRVYGWANSEQALFQQASQASQQVVASNHNWSSSTTARWQVPIQQQTYHTPAAVATNPGKHYVAFVMSDGDNVTWLTNGMGSDPKYFASPHRGKFNMTWDFSPSLLEMNPVAHNWFYQHAADGSLGGRDNFVAAGGAGLAFPSQYPAADLAGLAANTNASLAAADLRVTSILDTSYDANKLQTILDQPQLIGMMYKTYDTFYKGRAGALEFRNGKPILSVKYSLWDGADSANSIAAALNSAPSKDAIDDQGSYTIVNVHPWSTAGPNGSGAGDPMSNMWALIQQLDPTKVEVVGLEELMIHLRNHFGTPVPGAMINATWIKNGSFGWSARSNWSGAVPNFIDATVNFGSVITQNTSVNLNINATVGTINFNNANRYTIAGASSLTLNTTSGNAQINVIAGSHTINVPLTLAKNTTITVTPEASSLTISNLQATAQALTKTGAGTLVVNNIRAAGLSVAGGTVRISQNGGTSTVTSLDTSAGKLDLTNNKLIVPAGDVGTFTAGAYTGITGMIQSGRGDGSWNGAAGLLTSMTDATTGVLTTLAIATANETNYAGGTFGGQSVSASDVLVMYTWGGDADLNGELNGDDYFYIDSNILQSGSVFGFHNGDFDYNGVIDGDDYFILDSNILFAQNSPPFSTGAGAPLAAIPEPAALASLLVLGLSLPRRRCPRRA